MKTTLDDVRETFDLLDDWTERYSYLIELGSELEALDDSHKTDANKVKGCMSQVWLVGSCTDGKMAFSADSDAHIVRGLVALVLMIFADKTPEQVLATDAQAVLAELGLDQHLSPGRSNGLSSMIKKARALSSAALG